MTRRLIAPGRSLDATAVFLLTRIGALGIGLAAVVLSARIYGPEGRGVLAAFAVLQLLGATGLALGSGSGAFLAAHRDSHDRALVANGLLAIGLAIGLLATMADGLAWLAGIWTVAVPSTSAGVALALGPAVAGQYLILGWSQVAIGHGAIGRTATGWILGPSVLLASVAVAAIGGLAVSDLLLVQAALWFVAGVAFVAIGGGRRPDPAAARTILGLGRGAAVGDLTNALSYRLDVLLLVWLAGSAVAGVYSFAVQLLEPLWLLATSAAGGLLVAFRGRDDPTRRRDAVRTGLRVAALTAAGAIAVVALFPVASAVAGPGFEGIVAVGVVLAPGIVFLAVAKVFAAYQTSLGRLWLGSVIATLAVAIAVAGCLALIPGFGAAGAAAAASISYGVAMLLWLAAFRGLPSPDPEALPPGPDPVGAAR